MNQRDFQNDLNESKAILHRAGRDSETIGASNTARFADRDRAVFSHDASDGAIDDPVEIWGRRIGRSLGVLAVLGLGYYLIATYMV